MQNVKTADLGTNNTNWKQLFLVFALTVFYVHYSADLAFAGPIEDGVDWVVDLLTNGIARSAAIIACAVMGYMAWGGRLGWDLVIKFLVGIVFIFGGATIVDTFSGAVGS